MSLRWCVQANLRIAIHGAACLLIAVAGLAAGGDIEKGKSLVASSGCLNCHRIGETGSRVGPNLTTVGDRRTPERLQSSIVAPDEEVLPENRFVSVELKDGSAVRGRLLNHDATSIQLLDGKEHLRSFEMPEIRRYTILTKGLMPSFETRLSPQDMADVVAYLSSLKSTGAARP